MPTNPKVIDNDEDEIIVWYQGRELRGWSYANDTERRVKMLCAREYIEGWGDGRDNEQVEAAEVRLHIKPERDPDEERQKRIDDKLWDKQ